MRPQLIDEPQPVVVAVIRAVGICQRCHETKELTAHGALCQPCLEILTR